MRWMVPALAALLAAPAYGQSCMEHASDREAFEACTREEILPLEAKVVHLVNALRARYSRDARLLESFDRTTDAWNAYRNGQCSIESQRKVGEMEIRRAFAACTKRKLVSRIEELEGL